jgi:hypothetical protein
LLHNTVLLTEEIGHADYNIARSSQQKGKIIALSETIHQTLVFMENTSESAKENLIKAANKLRNNVEGGYFFRAENRIMTGILAALVSVAAIGIMLIPILLLTPVIPIISAALIVEIAGSFVVGIATLAASSKALLRSMYPLNPEQQTYSRGIYQEVNSLQPTLFKNKPREEEKRDASLQPSILHNPTLGVV